MSNDRINDVLEIILSDFADQNIGPGQNSPMVTIKQRMIKKKIMDMDDLINAINEGVSRKWLKSVSGGNVFELTEVGYERSQCLKNGLDVFMDGREMPKIEDVKNVMIIYLRSDIASLTEQTEDSEIMGYWNRTQGLLGAMMMSKLIDHDEIAMLSDEIGKAITKSRENQDKFGN